MMKKRNMAMIFCAAAAALSISACTGTTSENPTTGTTAAPATTAPTTTAPAVTEAESATEEPQDLVDLDKLLEDIQAAYGEEYIPSMEYSVEELENIFGLAPDLYDEAIAQGPMISVNIDTFISIKANSGKGEEVEQILADYRQDQIDNSLQYPMNLPKLYSSEVIRHGDYVFFVMLGTPTEESLDQGQDEALVSAKEKNQVAIDIINEAFGA